MIVKLGLALIVFAFAGCAGKKTVNDSWDSSPRACDAMATDACTPLPQEVKPELSVEAGLKNSGDADKIQYYRILSNDAKFSVIFIHGALGHASDFRKQFSRPVAGVNLLAFDRPGFGRSGNASEGATLDFQVKAAKTFLNDNKNLPVVIVGHSYGGAIALQLAIQNPQRVKGLVLVSAIVDPSQAAAYKVQGLLDSAGVLSGAVKQTNRELVKLQAGLEKGAPQVQTLKIPVEMVHGAKDDVVDVSNVAYLKAQLEKAGKASLFNAEICSDCGHRIPDQNPERVNAALERMKRRLE